MIFLLPIQIQLMRPYYHCTIIKSVQKYFCFTHMQSFENINVSPRSGLFFLTVKTMIELCNKKKVSNSFRVQVQIYNKLSLKLL